MSTEYYKKKKGCGKIEPTGVLPYEDSCCKICGEDGYLCPKCKEVEDEK